MFRSRFAPSAHTGSARAISVCAVALALSLPVGLAQAQEKTEEDGKWFDAEGYPTYHVAEDGTVDWYTYSGFRRYHSECHVCHGPDAEGSSYAPALKESMKDLSYEEYLEVVVNGREVMGQGTASKMPALGENLNVMCFIDDIYVYLLARADEAVPRGRPSKKARKPEEAREAEAACFGR